jgi:hypothetical protein
LYADRTRHLVDTDPDQRDLIISCGAALHHLRVALAAAGLAASVDHLPNPDDSDHLASAAAFRCRRHRPRVGVLRGR